MWNTSSQTAKKCTHEEIETIFWKKEGWKKIISIKPGIKSQSARVRQVKMLRQSLDFLSIRIARAAQPRLFLSLSEISKKIRQFNMKRLPLSLPLLLLLPRRVLHAAKRKRIYKVYGYPSDRGWLGVKKDPAIFKWRCSFEKIAVTLRARYTRRAGLYTLFAVGQFVYVN